MQYEFDFCSSRHGFQIQTIRTSGLTCNSFIFYLLTRAHTKWFPFTSLRIVVNCLCFSIVLRPESHVNDTHFQREPETCSEGIMKNYGYQGQTLDAGQTGRRLPCSSTSSPTFNFLRPALQKSVTGVQHLPIKYELRMCCPLKAIN
jgi:hypothetical protein